MLIIADDMGLDASLAALTEPELLQASMGLVAILVSIILQDSYLAVFLLIGVGTLWRIQLAYYIAMLEAMDAEDFKPKELFTREQLMFQ